MSHYFISYSSNDGVEFAKRLHDVLEAPPDKLPVWLDKRDLQEGRPWDLQIRDAIRDCGALLFAMTPDSVEDQSVCYEEWTLALSYKKHIVPLLVHPVNERPFRLHQHQYIDFTTDFDAGMARLREHLRFLNSPAGELQRLQDQLADAKRRYRRARDDAEARRIQDEINRLENEDIPRQKKLVDDPEGASERTQKSIAAGMERERQPERPVSGESRTKFINPPPATAPNYFQDRVVETREVGKCLADESMRLVTVVGRGGAGKTAMVCRLLKALENGQLPDAGGVLRVDGIVYLSALGSRRLDFPTLFADLSKLLPKEAADTLDTIYKNPQASAESKMRALLNEFTPESCPNGRVVVLLDNFEDVTDAATRRITNAELDEALRALLTAPPHPVKAVITTRITLADLPTIQPGRQRRFDLDAGLESPYAENLLREMDASGTLGLRDLPEDSPLLTEARERTRGIPRALEALFGILAADTSTSLAEILDEIKKREARNDAGVLLPDAVTEALVGEAFSRLDETAQKVIQALAIYGRPVPPVAVDTLLQPYIPGIDSSPVLARLVNMHFARKEVGRFYLHPVDRAYALARIPRGETSDRPPWAMQLFTRMTGNRQFVDEIVKRKFTQITLFYAASEYVMTTRKPRSDWKHLSDIQPQLDEYDLRCEGEDWEAAADVLEDIYGDFLLINGYYNLCCVLYENLRGKVRTESLKQSIEGNLGTVYYGMGQFYKAIECYESALATNFESDDVYGRSIWVGNLANVYAALGDLDKAMQYYEQALKACRKINNLSGEATYLANFSESRKMNDR